MIAYMVWGPESTGTRLTTRLLIHYGCLGDGDHAQHFDELLPAPVQPIVWRRSFPHAMRWPNTDFMLNKVISAGYEPFIIVTTRDFFATVKSQVNAGHVKTEQEAVENIRKAYLAIYETLNRYGGIPYSLFSYGNLVLRAENVMKYNFPDLPQPDTPFEVHDANRKWYGEE